nr:hypothetical protein [Brucella anthropi]DAM62862.1 MAG TPA: hypothetical protein [Caudoviricetes sp.]
MKLTEARFARRCASIAQVSSNWAAELMDSVDQRKRDAEPNAVFRFTKSIRERLDWLDEEATLAVPTACGKEIDPSVNRDGWLYFPKRAGRRWEVWYRRLDGEHDPHNGATEWKASSLRFWRKLNAERLADDITRHYHNGLQIARARNAPPHLDNTKD